MFVCFAFVLSAINSIYKKQLILLNTKIRQFVVRGEKIWSKNILLLFTGQYQQNQIENWKWEKYFAKKHKTKNSKKVQ